MASRWVLAVVGAFTISLLAVGAGGAAVCDPHCSPGKSHKGDAVSSERSNKDGEFSPERSNKWGELRGEDRANWVHQLNKHNDAGGTGGDPGGTPPPPPPPPPPGPCTGC